MAAKKKTVVAAAKKKTVAFVVSALTCAQAYTKYHVPEGSDIPVPLKKVVIQGGHGVANKNFVTPQGVCTAITAEDLEMLRLDPMFARHEKANFVKVLKKNPGVDVEKVAAGSLAEKDKSAPITEEELEGKTGSTE